MKVAIYLGNKQPESGGAYTFVNEILHALINYGPETKHVFVIFGDSKEAPREIDGTNIQFVSLYRSLTKRIISRFYRFICIPFTKVQILNNHFKRRSWLEKLYYKNNIEMIWSFMPARHTMDIPYITVVWDLQHRLQPFFPEVSVEDQWNLREEYYSKMLRRAACVITGTKVGKLEIARFYQIPPERIKVLPHPTPLLHFDLSKKSEEMILSKYNIPDGFLFYPTQFWPHKNHIGLLTAIKLLRDEYNIRVSVVFVGSDKGNLRFVKQKVVELGLPTQVFFLGFVPREDLIYLYRRAFALTYLTFFGPENLPPLEAFALGCPVIASNVSGAEEQLRDAALLVDAKDEKQIALAIKSLYDDNVLRQTLIQRGFLRAKAWTAQDFIKEIFKMLDEFESIRRCWSNTDPYQNKK